MRDHLRFWITLAFKMDKLLKSVRKRMDFEPGGVRSNEVEGGERVISNNNPLFDVYFDTNLGPGEKINHIKFPLEDAHQVWKSIIDQPITVTCVGDTPIKEDWTSREGRVYTDNEIKTIMEKAAKTENYEYAAKCRDELERRADQFVKDIVSKIN